MENPNMVVLLVDIFNPLQGTDAVAIITGASEIPSLQEMMKQNERMLSI